MDTIPLFHNKNIVLGVCGGIAAYKVADLASKLTQAGAQVDVILTEGYKREASLRIEVSRRDHTTELISAPSELLALVAAVRRCISS